MKKISLIALAFSISTAMFAQDNQMASTTPMARSVYFGVKAGVNLAEFRIHSVNPKPEVNMKTSGNGGFFVNLPIAGKLFLQPELLYSGQGSKYSSTNALGTRTNYEQDLSYIALPIMLQIKSPGGFFVEVGPQPAYMLRAQLEANNTTTNNEDSFDKFDISLNGGLGYTSRVGLGINARYTLGLSNVIEDGGGNNSPNNGPEMKNSVVQIGLFYMFGARK